MGSKEAAAILIYLAELGIPRIDFMQEEIDGEENFRKMKKEVKISQSQDSKLVSIKKKLKVLDRRGLLLSFAIYASSSLNASRPGRLNTELYDILKLTLSDIFMFIYDMLMSAVGSITIGILYLIWIVIYLYANSKILSLQGKVTIRTSQMSSLFFALSA